MYYTREYLNRAHREIDTIFRVLFPEHGMAVREEQIMLCHKMLDNLLGRNIALCDAGCRYRQDVCLSGGLMF